MAYLSDTTLIPDKHLQK